ncbi:MAG: T9SS C-terminal target domain-containing protein, partial [Ignavibacteriae bacterium]
WVVNPAGDGNDVTVLGAEVTSNVVPLVNMTSGTSQGVIAGASGFVALDTPPGSNSGVDLTFANGDNVKQFPVDVRYLFRIGADGEQQFSDVVNYIARVPGVDPDKIAGDNTKPTNVRTFAMSFTNANGFDADVHRIHIRSTGSARILAVGPAGTDATQAMLSPISNDGGSFMVSALEDGGNGVAPTTVVRPIYITLSEVDGPAPFTFITLDLYGEPISEGAFELTDPIASIHGDEAGDNNVRQVVDLTVSPNPTNATSTMSVSLDRSMNRVQLLITNLQGETVMTVYDQAMDSGHHVVHTNVNTLASGTYFVVVRTPFGVTSQPMTVAK